MTDLLTTLQRFEVEAEAGNKISKKWRLKRADSG